MWGDYWFLDTVDAIQTEAESTGAVGYLPQAIAS